MSTNKESFKPITNDPPIGLVSGAKFYLRLILDFQTLTLYSDLKKFLSGKKGKLLDIGCGNSPYRHLLCEGCEYAGIDIENQGDFDYHNDDIKRFNGYDVPFKNGSIDSFICTEVLEHIYDPKKLISEMKRVLRTGGTGLVSIPWSARNHYIPYDFCRYTPAALGILFADFEDVHIKPRGTDITVICSKSIVSVMGMFRSCTGIRLILIPFITLIAIPAITLSVTVGHLSLILGFGSTNDPLGYTITLSK